MPDGKYLNNREAALAIGVSHKFFQVLRRRHPLRNVSIVGNRFVCLRVEFIEWSASSAVQESVNHWKEYHERLRSLHP